VLDAAVIRKIVSFERSIEQKLVAEIRQQAAEEKS
jgi:hypothetical protein